MRRRRRGAADNVAAELSAAQRDRPREHAFVVDGTPELDYDSDDSAHGDAREAPFRWKLTPLCNECEARADGGVDAASHVHLVETLLFGRTPRRVHRVGPAPIANGNHTAEAKW